MDLRRFSLVRGASVTGGSGGVAGNLRDTDQL